MLTGFTHHVRRPAGPARTWAMGVALCILTLAIVVGGASAAGGLQFLGAFGSEGTGSSQFEAPHGVAVDISTDPSRGDVYVTEAKNQRVDKFNAAGGFILMFGREVNATKVKESSEGKPITAAEENVCIAASGDTCGAATKEEPSGSSSGQFREPESVAVDESTEPTDSSKGDIYVGDFGGRRVEKFSPSGEFILMFGGEVNETKDDEAGATEAEKNVCTAASGDVCKVGVTGTGKGQFEAWPAASNIAVGPEGTIFVGDKARVQEFDPSGSWTGELQLSALSATAKVNELAVGPDRDLYLTDQGIAGVRKFEPEGASYKESATTFDTASTTITAIAVEPDSGALDLVDTNSPGGGVRLIRYPGEGGVTPVAESEGGLLAASAGIAANLSGTIYAADSKNEPSADKVLIFGEAPREGLPSPSIDAESVSDLGAESATVAAGINPFFLQTSYYVQYVGAAGYQPTAPDPYAAGGIVPSGSGIALGGAVLGDQPASVTLPGLSSGTTYHFRFVARSPAGTTFGADQTFTTFPSGGFSGLPDGRAFELVSSLKKNGNEAGTGPTAVGIEVTKEGQIRGAYGVASADGESALYHQQGPSGETHSGSALYSVSNRNPLRGWEVRAALPPGCGFNASNATGEKPHSLYPSADLSHFVFEAEGPYGAGNCGSEENSGLYRTALNASEPEWWLSKPTIANPEPNPIGTTRLIPVGGSPDLASVYFTYAGTLVPEDASRASHVDTGAESSSTFGFYEWTEGKLASAGILPNEPGEPGYDPEKTPSEGEPDPYGAVPAATIRQTSTGETTFEPSQLDNEVSSDGSKAFFLSPEPERAEEAGTPTELYVREQGKGGPATVLVSRDELSGGGPAPGAGAETAVVPVNGPRNPYVYASRDGSRAFFASSDQLTSTAPPGSDVKEYEFNLDTMELAYLPAFTEPASAPFSTILASSEDGSSLLFENNVDHKLELWERPVGGGESVAEVASFSTPSAPTFKARAVRDGDLTAFALQTDAVLSGGFNNSAATQQVYRYVPGRKLTCVSCAPEGTAQSSAQSFGWARVVADGGARIFFTTAEKLLARDVNGVRDVYEWEQAGSGSCRSEERGGGCIYLISSGTSPDPSLYIDNSESGRDVFFATAQGLVTGDADESYDVYDAREGGGFPVEATVPGCVSGCQGQSASQPNLGIPAGSALFPAGQNVLAPILAAAPKPASKPKPLTRAQKLAKALKACKRQLKRSRAACVKRAEKLYGKRAQAKKSKRRGGR